MGTRRLAMSGDGGQTGISPAASLTSATSPCLYSVSCCMLVSRVSAILSRCKGVAAIQAHSSSMFVERYLSV